jgi:cytochrome P450 family 110
VQWSNSPTDLRTGSPLPPGPGFLETFNFVRKPFAFMDDCARRFCDWFTVRVPGVSPFIFTSDPTAVREVFLGDTDVLHAGKANRPLGAFMGEKSVLFLDGAAHLHERRLVLPAFQGERMKTYGAMMRSIAREAFAKFPIGETFAMDPRMHAITFDVIMRAVFGLDDSAEPARLKDAIRRFFDVSTGRFGSLLQLPAMQVDLGPWSPWGKLVRINREVEALLFAEFARRREENRSGREDILSMLLMARDEKGAPISDGVLRDEMMTLILAGHETTAASLAWAVNRMVTNPEVMEAARAESVNASGDGDVNALKYLDAVINETMRLDPVVPNVGRELQAPMKIAGRDLPKGVLLAPCIYLTHRRADLWSEPERFNPARFLDARPNPYGFFPFGGGTRRCIGAAFATYQMKVVLSELLRSVELAPASGYVAKPIRSSIALAPSEGMPVRLTRRF